MLEIHRHVLELVGILLDLHAGCFLKELEIFFELISQALAE